MFVILCTNIDSQREGLEKDIFHDCTLVAFIFIPYILLISYLWCFKEKKKLQRGTMRHTGKYKKNANIKRQKKIIKQLNFLENGVCHSKYKSAYRQITVFL